MATFTITTTQNIDELVGKTGGDTYNINGGVLTIDQHSRFGLNNANTSATAATSMGNATISATLGGQLIFEGRYVRMIPFNGGSGTIPALNSLVTQGSASGKLVCVYSSLTAAPVTSGAMPATGWIMVKQWNSVAYAAGALTLSGVTANATGPDVVGFLEIFGDDAATMTLNRLGTAEMRGAWYELGTTNGSAGQTFQIPNHGTLRHFAGVFIEKSVGSNTYEFYPNGGTTVTTGTTVATGTEAARGKVVWINNTGLVTIGNSGGTGLNGHVPVTGLKVVIPNIFLCCCTTTARNAEVIPNATLATRYDFTTTGGGVLIAEKANFCWYPSFVQPYAITMTDCGVIDAITISEAATATNWTRVGIGNKPTTALATNPFIMSLCPNGGNFTECVFARVPTTANNSSSVSIVDSLDFTFTDCKFLYTGLRAHTLPATVTLSRANGFKFIRPVTIDGYWNVGTCQDLEITDFTYINAIVGTTGTANPISALQFTGGCTNVKVIGWIHPVSLNQPYTNLINIASASCNKIYIRNFGTLASPVDCGATNGTQYPISIAANAAAYKIYIQRVYTSNTRTGFITCDNSSKEIYMENAGGDYADASDPFNPADSFVKGKIGGLLLTAVAGVYGLHWVDYFTANNAGRIAIFMNEPTAFTADQVAITGGAAFTSGGGLYMPTVGQTATFTMSYFALGHTSFQNTALVMAGGGAVGNFRFRYQIDKGAGFSTWSASDLTAAALGTALNAETGIDPAVGVKLKLEIKTTTANTAAITSVYLVTNSSTAAQGNLYPLDLVTLQLTGVQPGSDIVILEAGTETDIVNADAITGSTYSYLYSTVGQVVDIGVFKTGYIPFYIRGYTLGSADSVLPVSQTADRNYINP